MAETINTNVFDANKKFVDFSGLDYFWTKAKNYIDGVDTAMSAKVVTLENTVGDSTKGLVKDVKAIQDELNSLSGGAGSITTQIDNAIAALDLPNTYETKGAADTALADAKSYVDGKVDGKFDAAGTAAGLDAAMDARVKVLEAIDHDAIAAAAAATAVAGVIDGAPEKFDTLKEIAAWIADADTAEDAASLVTRVSALEAIDHDAYVAADETVLADAKDYADGLADNYEVAGAAKTAEDNAKAYADSLAVNYDAKGAAATALADAKTYTDGKVDGKFDAIGSADAAQAAAIAQAKLDAEAALANYYKKSETYSKTEVDNLLSTNSTGDRAYAKQYTDELFNSFSFASNSDIDALFV